MTKKFKCDECCEMKMKQSSNINGIGIYCDECIIRIIAGDINDVKEVDIEQ